MVGRFKIIRGVNAPAGSTLPKISVDSTDKILAGIVNNSGIPALRYDFNPTIFSNTVESFSLYGKDRGSGKVVSAQRSAVTKIISEPSFAANPAFSFTDGTGDTAGLSSDLKMMGPVGSNFTWFAVATIDASLKAAPSTARLMIAVGTNPVSVKCFLGLNSSGNLVMGPSPNDANVSANIPVGNVPAANVPFVVCGVYNVSTQRTSIYLNGTAITDVSNAAVSVTPEASDVFGLGGPGGFATNAGWKGKLARAVVYDGALNTVQLDTVFSALKSKYAVS